MKGRNRAKALRESVEGKTERPLAPAQPQAKREVIVEAKFHREWPMFEFTHGWRKYGSYASREDAEKAVKQLTKSHGYQREFRIKEESQ
jgi:hypothetical protein